MSKPVKRFPVGTPIRVIGVRYSGPQRRSGPQSRRRRERRKSVARVRWLNHYWTLREITPNELMRMPAQRGLISKEITTRGFEGEMRKTQELFELDLQNRMKEVGISRERAIRRILRKQRFYLHYFSDFKLTTKPRITHYLLALDPVANRFYWASTQRQPLTKDRRSKEVIVQKK